MYVEVPDRYPGRCRNHRWFVNGMVRCLDYEGVPHVCEFPEPPRTYSWGGTVTVTTTWKHMDPEPWVKPGDTNDIQE